MVLVNCVTTNNILNKFQAMFIETNKINYWLLYSS